MHNVIRCSLSVKDLIFFKKNVEEEKAPDSVTCQGVYLKYITRARMNLIEEVAVVLDVSFLHEFGGVT